MQEAQTNGCIEQDVAWLAGQMGGYFGDEGKAKVVGAYIGDVNASLQDRSMCLSRCASETSLRSVYCHIDAGLSLRQSNTIKIKK
jgi:hypothetical protein